MRDIGGHKACLALALTVFLIPMGVRAGVDTGVLLATHETPADVSSGAPVAVSGDSVTTLSTDKNAAPMLQNGTASAPVLKASGTSASNARQDDGGVIQPASLTIDARAARAYTVADTAYPVDPVTAAHSRQFGTAKTAPVDAEKIAAPALGEADGHTQMPYALVLALFALIGLVPVSRRNH